MKAILFFIFSMVSLIAIGQPADTLIYAQGKIVNGVTKEPVEAKISYQSLPYGSKIGFVKGSSFSFPMFDNEKYSVTIEAEGFAPSKYLLDPAEANQERKVVRDIELHLPGSAAHNAETTHTVGKVMRLDDLIFQAGSSKIASSSFEVLNEVVTMLKNNPRMVIQLEGHTDFIGNAKSNLKLSQERVDAVKNYVVSKGANKAKIKTKAFGGTNPLSRENTEEARKMNRRVELRVLEN